MQPHGAPIRLPANLALVGVAFLGLLFAGFLGAMIGENDVRTLGLIFGAGFAVFFLVVLHRYVWQIALVLVFIGIGYRPTGFTFGALELTCGLAFAVAALFAWQKKEIKRPAVLETPEFTFLRRAIFVWLIYVVIHMVWNFQDPFRPGEFRASNAIKSYFGLSAPLLVLFYFSSRPTGLNVKGKFFWRIVQFTLIGLIVNLFVRALELGGVRLVEIPIINSSPNFYALRTLGPFAMLLGTIALTGAEIRKASVFRKLTYLGLVLLGTAGAVMSSGRAAIIYGFVLVCVAVLMRKKFGLFLVAFALGLVGLALVQVSADWINAKANPYVQRSLQLILFERSWETLATMESSTNWRRELANRALHEWQSHPRIYWFGRATFGYGTQDDRAILAYGGYEALIQSSLRRGATHNLFTDLLVAYGLVGCILYCVTYFATIYFLWKLRRRKELTPPAADLALFCALLAPCSFFLEAFGVGTYRTELMWLMVILIVSLYSRSGLRRDLPETGRLVPVLPVARPIQAAPAGHRAFKRTMGRQRL